MKWLGIWMLAAVCAAAGQYAASQLRRRIRLLEAAISLGTFLKTQLPFTLAEPPSMVEEALRMGMGEELPFLQTCRDLCKNGVPFPFAWQSSLKEGAISALTREDKAVLAQMGEVLGATGLEGQLERLSLVQSRLSLQLESAARKNASEGKLYRSLGILGGLGLAIFLL